MGNREPGGSRWLKARCNTIVCTVVGVVGCARPQTVRVASPESPPATPRQTAESSAASLDDVPAEVLPPDVRAELPPAPESAPASDELPNIVREDDDEWSENAPADKEPKVTEAPSPPPPPSVFHYEVGSFNTPSLLVALGFAPTITILSATGSRSFPYEPFPDLAQIEGRLVVLNQELSGVATFWPNHYAAVAIGADAPLPGRWICWLPGQAMVAVEYDVKQNTLRARAETNQNLLSLAACFAPRVARFGYLVSQAARLAPRSTEHLWVHVVIGFDPQPTIRCLDFALLDVTTKSERSVLFRRDGHWSGLESHDQVERDRCDFRDAGANERFEMPGEP